MAPLWGRCADDCDWLATNRKRPWLRSSFLALGLYKMFMVRVHDKRAHEAPQDGRAPPLWIRSLLLLTCTGVSFSHGTNDGQKSIGLTAFLFHQFF